MELKAGMWIAKGPEINVLLLLHGKSPLLEIKGAIDLNHFYATGKAKDLDIQSTEVTDILLYPENYTFDPPAITDVITNIEGIGKTTYASYKEVVNDEDIEKCVNYYKSVLPIYGLDSSKVRLRLYAMRELGLKLSQASLLSNDILKKIQGQ